MSRFIAITLIQLDAKDKSVKQTTLWVDPATIITLERQTLQADANRLLSVTHVQAVKEGALLNFNALQTPDVIISSVEKALEERVAVRTMTYVAMPVPKDTTPEQPG